MSVVLTACRHSKQRAIERALKKKADKRRKRQQRRTQSYLEHLERQRRLAEQQYACEYEVALEELALSRMWTFKIDTIEYTVVLVLESGREIVDIYCNEEELSYATDINNGSIQFDFLIEGCHKARINCARNKQGGLQHTLIVRGDEIPEYIE